MGWDIQKLRIVAALVLNRTLVIARASRSHTGQRSELAAKDLIIRLSNAVPFANWAASRLSIINLNSFTILSSLRTPALPSRGEVVFPLYCRLCCSQTTNYSKGKHRRNEIRYLLHI